MLYDAGISEINENSQTMRYIGSFDLLTDLGYKHESVLSTAEILGQ